MHNKMHSAVPPYNFSTRIPSSSAPVPPMPPVQSNGYNWKLVNTAFRQVMPVMKKHSLPGSISAVNNHIPVQLFSLPITKSLAMSRSLPRNQPSNSCPIKQSSIPKHLSPMQEQP